MDRRLFATALVLLLTGLLLMPSLADERETSPPPSPLWDSEDVIAEDSTTVTVDPLKDPATINDCQDGGWHGFGFRNQGQCIRFVNTGMDSR